MNKNIRHNIGDRVVALTNPENEDCQPRIKGNVYTVESVIYCSKCGTQLINIGFVFDLSVYEDGIECDCGYDIITNDDKYYTDSELFAKVDDLENTLNECVENEDYEFASILRDILKETQHI